DCGEREPPQGARRRGRTGCSERESMRDVRYDAVLDAPIVAPAVRNESRCEEDAQLGALRDYAPHRLFGTRPDARGALTSTCVTPTVRNESRCEDSLQGVAVRNESRCERRRIWG